MEGGATPHRNIAILILVLPGRFQTCRAKSPGDPILRSRSKFWPGSVNSCGYGSRAFNLLPHVVKCAADKNGETRKAAKEASRAFCEQISKHAVKLAIPVLLDLAENETKWQIKELCLILLEELVDVAPLLFVRSLPIFIPVVSSLMWSTKKQVKKAATVAIEAACEAIDNKDLEDKAL